jgi:hypothetical protein
MSGVIGAVPTSSGTGRMALLPKGTVIQVLHKQLATTITGNGTTAVYESDANGLTIAVKAGNRVTAAISGGMQNAETTVSQFKLLVRFKEASANQDFQVQTFIGGNFSPDLHHPGVGFEVGCIAAETGDMIVQRGTINSNAGQNTVWTSEASNYGKIHYVVTEIQA